MGHLILSAVARCAGAREKIEKAKAKMAGDSSKSRAGCVLMNDGCCLACRVTADEEKKEERAAVVSGPAKFFGATLSQAVNM